MDASGKDEKIPSEKTNQSGSTNGVSAPNTHTHTFVCSGSGGCYEDREGGAIHQGSVKILA